RAKIVCFSSAQSVKRKIVLLAYMRRLKTPLCFSAEVLLLFRINLYLKNYVASLFCFLGFCQYAQ
ncbi:TPA: hypothetical protein ACY37O_002477, partial [Pasteurella multocida]